jgi:hypothetical protein
MKERSWIEPIVERVVGQVMDSHVAQLRSEIVRAVMEEIAAAAAEHDGQDARPTSSTAELARSVAEIQQGSSQKEILRALLDASAHYAARVALFVVKGSHATGWQGRGFTDNDAVKDFALDENAAAVASAIGDRVAASVPVDGLDPRFLKEFGTPASGEGRVLPLILKDKVAALVYADAGTDADGSMDGAALDLLVLSTSAWLEVNSLRKHAQKEPVAAHSESHPAESYPADARAVPAEEPSRTTAPAFNDPFAAHTPAYASGHAKAAAAAAGESSVSAGSDAVAAPSMASETTTAEAHSTATEVQSVVDEAEPALAEPLAVGHAETQVVSETPPPASISPADQDVHRKAQRFARLLVDEIKLYNQAKVAEGRKNKDLYDRLKETIEKSRATYQKRYGSTVAVSGNYFQHEIIRSLAEDDLSIMGANFRQ